MQKNTKWIIGASAGALLIGGLVGGGIVAATDAFDNDDDDRANVSSVTGNGSGNGDSSPGNQGSQQIDADDQPISDDERTQATEAALAEVGQGTATDLDRSDDLDHAWEVEVTLDNGQDIDVDLDDDYTVVRVDGVVPTPAP